MWDEADWPNGWLAKVPALAERRGSAPATVAALQGHAQGTVDKPAGTSIGAHALTRTLPVALGPPLDPAAIAALTHGGEALAAARLGVEIVRLVASGEHLDAAVDRVLLADEDRSEGAARSLALALAAARSRPGQRSELAGLAPDAKAVSALAGGVYVALSFPDRRSIRDALSVRCLGRRRRPGGDGGWHAAGYDARARRASGRLAVPAGVGLGGRHPGPRLRHRNRGQPVRRRLRSGDRPALVEPLPRRLTSCPLTSVAVDIAGRDGSPRYQLSAALIVGTTVSYRYGALVSRPQWSVNLMADG